MMARGRSKRTGFSLLEAILALSILGLSLGVLSGVMRLGVDAAIEADDLVSCRMACSSSMASLLLDADSGVTPVAMANAPLSSFRAGGDRALFQDVEVQQGNLDGLLMIRITVRAMENDGVTETASISLVRWIIDPTLDLEGAEEEMEAAAEEEVAG